MNARPGPKRAAAGTVGSKAAAGAAGSKGAAGASGSKAAAGASGSKAAAGVSGSKAAAGVSGSKAAGASGSKAVGASGRKATGRVRPAKKTSGQATIVTGPQHPTTLAIDIGGTGLKASVLDASGRLLADRVRVATTYPCPPEKMVDDLVKLVKPLPPADRASAGFPGVVRRGLVLTAPHFVTKSGPGTEVVPKLVAKWKGFDLAGTLGQRLGIPVRVANDADLQGWAVVSGKGLEMVVTLGTGVGSALFLDGKLAPHLELAQHPFRKNQTYNEQIGNAALLKIGPAKWRKRVLKAIGEFDSLVNYDRLYLGGGNGHRMAGHVDPSIKIVDNVAGILGGIKLWEVGSHGNLYA